MEFRGQLNEYFLLDNLKKNDVALFSENNELFSICWNSNNTTTLVIDNVPYVLKPYQMVFLTEMHQIAVAQVDDLHCIRFNRSFYCLDNHDSEIGCKGVLFFGASQVPIIDLSPENWQKFDLLWGVFLTELQSEDKMQGEMLQMLLKRFLILATRIFKENNKSIPFLETKMDVIRTFSYLVEVHYKTKHTVAEYADLLNKPAKSLTNLFANHIEKSPLKIIQERIFLEAKRILLNSEKSIKETAFELGFEDIQSFSRFFKNQQGVSPKEFRATKSLDSLR